MSLETATIRVFVSTDRLDCFAATWRPVPPANAAVEAAAAARASTSPTNQNLRRVRCSVFIPLLLSRIAPRSRAADHAQIARQTAEAFAPFLRHVDDLLEPDADLARQVDARLDAVDHPDLELDVLAAHDP